ncbi:MAG: 23S rRNA (adenine(2503)-C(2))-methyltransferase RlmN [Candidatus Glassbacteria bacterium]|nr:23S rRNA (adenine(2503)-C(2))-methyltransferase RlmN [Candidatus Glassbacteria bacterium]
MGEMIKLLDLGPEALKAELSQSLAQWEEKPFRARQVIRQVYQRCKLDFQDMTDLPAALRSNLAGTYLLQLLTPLERAVSADGTVKTLWELGDSARVESVAIPMEAGRRTFCLSTQTGCGLGCSFCATGKLGAGRNLSAGEIICQALAGIAETSLSSGPRVDGSERTSSPNLVFMGMGEPLLNYDNLKTALEVLNHPELAQVGSRRITVSTVGLPEQIVRFCRDFPQMKLAVSLHAATESLRRTLMPVAGKVSLSDLVEACREANLITGKRITFEYLVIPGVNDRQEDIQALARLCGLVPSKINLIGLNPAEGVPFRPPRAAELARFRDRLSSACSMAVTLRRSHGADIAGACGQLAAGQAPRRR